MGKLFLLILFGVAVYLMLKRGQRSTARPPSTPPTAETMIQCAHCRIHVPLSESMTDGNLRYCCEEHRRLGRR